MCIAALAGENKGKKYIPYRNSKLTRYILKTFLNIIRILQDTLDGNCKIVFLICVSPSLASINETF